MRNSIYVGVMPPLEADSLVSMISFYYGASHNLIGKKNRSRNVGVGTRCGANRVFIHENLGVKSSQHDQDDCEYASLTS